MPKTFSGVGKSRHADVIARVMAIIAARGTTEFADLLRIFQYDIDKNELTAMLLSLEAQRFCRIERSGATTTIVYTEEDEHES
jgi:hypothetical protein